MKKLIVVALVVLAGLVTGSPVSAQDRVETFETPDVRNDFCGGNISFQFCRCAFHDEDVYCSAVEMDQSGARRHVMNAFKEWVAQRIEAFAANCIRNGGEWNKGRRTCTYPAPDEPQTIEERYNLPDLSSRPASPSPRPVGKLAATDDCKVFLYMSSFKKWKGPIQGGQDIYQHDVMLTSGGDNCRGSATVTLYSSEGQDTIHVAPDTWLETPLREDPADTSFLGELKRGAVRFYDVLTGSGAQQVDPTPFNVRTPTIVTGRRGTEFLVTYDDATGVSEVLMREGEVDVTPVGSDETVTLTANESARHEGDSLQVSEITSRNWDDALKSHGLSNRRITVDPEDLVPPSGPPVEFLRAELVGDLSFLDSQFGGGGFPAKAIFTSLVIASVLVLMAGVAIMAPLLLLPPEARYKKPGG